MSPLFRCTSASNLERIPHPLVTSPQSLRTHCTPYFYTRRIVGQLLGLQDSHAGPREGQEAHCDYEQICL